MTEKGYMALVSRQVEIGDIIYLLLSGSVFFVFRPKGDSSWLICERYIHGWMDGKAVGS
jgi:hypothetical protein